MRRIFGRRRLVFLMVLAFAAAAAVGGYAYFTTTGSGTGSAGVSSSAATLTITQSNTISGLLPGGSAEAVQYSITNTAGNGDLNLGKVTVSNITIDTTHASAGCLASWFSATAPSSAVGTILDGATYTSAAATEPSISMSDSGSSQDSCQGATVSFDLNAAQGS